MQEVTIVTDPPVVTIVADTRLVDHGLEEVISWVRSARPECMLIKSGGLSPADRLVPYSIGLARANDGLTDAEVLIELAGRGCYQSYGDAAGKKTNAEYIKNTQKGPNPHKSILYHAKFTLFIAGISRRMSHELIRHYVGADRSEELSPSQESTRFTHHHGRFICPINRIGDPVLMAEYRGQMQRAYDGYQDYVKVATRRFADEHHGNFPKGLDRKRIFEDASNQLPHSAETSLYITMNPESAAKMIRERTDSSADLEFIRFAKKLNNVLASRYKNLFEAKE